MTTLGCTVYSHEPEAHVAAIRQYFDLVVPNYEMMPACIHPGIYEYQFAGPDYNCDAIVGMAESLGLPVRGHPLVWDHFQPGWMLQYPQSYNAGGWRGIFKDHIRRVMHRYPAIHEWVVVNEALHPNRATGGWEARVPGHLAIAFQTARECAPDGFLIYNEYGAELAQGTPRHGTVTEALFELLKRLLEDAPGCLNGVGFQCHLDLSLSPLQIEQELAANMQRVKELGLEPLVTEVDVATWENPASPVTLQRQAAVFRAVALACRHVGARSLTQWGLNDGRTWLSGPQEPLLLDTALRPKPAMDAVWEVLAA